MTSFVPTPAEHPRIVDGIVYPSNLDITLAFAELTYVEPTCFTLLTQCINCRAVRLGTALALVASIFPLWVFTVYFFTAICTN